MDIKILNDFVHVADVEEQLQSEYSDRLPKQILDIWRDYGFGHFFDGYLKIINPNDYVDLIKESYFLAVAFLFV